MPFAHKGVLVRQRQGGTLVVTVVTNFRKYKLTSDVGFLFGFRVGCLS